MVNLQPFESFIEKRRKMEEKNGRVFPDDNDLAIGGIRRLKAAMLVFDIVDSSSYSIDDFIEYLSPFLHTCFHAVNSNSGIVDKYTGDGAMISFCGSGMSEKDSCKFAIETALDISEIAYLIKKNYNFPEIEVRIGIDYGPIKVERMGVRGKTQLIIVEHTATIAKRLEEIGNEVEFDKHSTIMLGHDVYYNLSEKRKGFCSRHNPSK